MSAARRFAAVAATAAAVTTAVITGPAAAATTTAGACTGTSGVTVVVDFAELGGGIETRCAPGDPASGLEALTGAGFTYDFVPGYPGFICRIDELPDPCNGAPVTAYWSYWHAQPGGSWSYSQLGAGNYDPAPGSVEGWAFGAGQEPGVNP
ncbi:hypothetical protein SAMN05421810_108145 [Amycolatopsis arida]|uniref:Uncharacterized protein n=1 Tax=Amycolatopsis arida TaxID=587909 RepID=A0A1I5Z278_9PSEU|nr:hypothetical protein [Amycolatopsis arida]TDX90058.1 hypothetical protein CLV69_108145 [Amycolatopsis arida]SFQ50539.1 hypothetical protein SAMN05421810_108145 [Amycolatopsis arida]